MANILGSLTLNEVAIAELDSDPTLSGGTDLPLGSIATISNGINGQWFVKAGPLATDWRYMDSSSPIRKVLMVTKTPDLDEFASVSAAITAAIALSPSASNPIVILIGAGIFSEAELTIPSYVNVIGQSLEATTIEANATNHNVVNLESNAHISFLRLQGASDSGFVGLNFVDSGDYSLAHKVEIINCAIGIKVSTVSIDDSRVYLEYVDTADCPIGLEVFPAADKSAYVSLENFYVVNSTIAATYGIYTHGGDCLVTATGFTLKNTFSVSGDAVYSTDAEVELIGGNIEGWVNAINCPISATDPIQLQLTSIAFKDCTNELVIQAPNASGYFNGYTDHAKNSINTANSFFITNADSNVISVAQKGGDHRYITDAIAMCLNPTVSNRYIISVGPGIFNEAPFTLPQYVSIVGSNIISTVIQCNATTTNFITCNENSEISFCTINGNSLATNALFAADIGGNSFFQTHKVSISGSDVGIRVETNTTDSYVYLEYTDINCPTGIECISTDGNINEINANECGIYADAITPIYGTYCDGAGALIRYTSGVIQNYVPSAGIGMYTINGGVTRTVAARIIGYSTGISVPNTGSNSAFYSDSMFIFDTTTTLNIASPTASGYYSGYLPYGTYSINSSSSFFITNKDPNAITVSKTGGDFSTIKAAVDSITTASITNPFLISVGPGVFTEDTITMKPYIGIEGAGRSVTVIKIDAADKHLIIGADNASIRRCTLQGTSGEGYACVYYKSSSATTKAFVLFQVFFGTCNTMGICDGSTTKSTLRLENCLMGSDFNYSHGFEAIGGSRSIIAVQNFAAQGTVVGPVYPDPMFKAHGANAEILLNCVQVRCNANTGTTFLHLYNGGGTTIVGTFFSNFAKGIWCENVGAAPFIDISGLNIQSCTQDIVVDHPGTTGSFSGTADFTKVTVNSASSLNMSYADHGIAGHVVLQDLYQGSRQDRLINLSKMARETATMGVSSGGVITAGTGTEVSITSGSGFLIDPTDRFVKEITWLADTAFDCGADSDHYIYVDTNGDIQHATAEPDYETVIVLGRVKTNASSIDFIASTPVSLPQYANENEEFLRRAIGPVFNSGAVVTENGSNARRLDVTDADYYFGTINLISSGGAPITFDRYYRASPSGWTVTASQNTVDNANYDDGSGTLQSLGLLYYAKHWLYMVANGGTGKYFLITSQDQYLTLLSAQTAMNPIIPSWMRGEVVQIASIIVRQATTNIVEIRDERPRIGFSASAQATSNKHGDLSGLTNDDHAQYLLVGGSRAMTSNLNMGSQNITSVGTVDGVTVSAHESRHLPNGSDALTTAAPSTNISATSTNSVGTANSLSRSDHVHALNTAAPSTQTPDQTNAVGSSASLARADHIHAISTAAASSVGSSNTQGSATSFSRSDHQHRGISSLKANSAGTVRYGDIVLQQGLALTIVDNGSGTFTFDTVAGPNELFVTYGGSGLSVSYTSGKVILNGSFTSISAGSIALTASQSGWVYVSIAGVVAQGLTLPPNSFALAQYTTDTSNVTVLNDRRIFANQNLIWGLTADVASLTATTATAAGTSDKYARADHAHAISSGVVSSQTPDQTNATGTSTNFSRADHVHNIATATAVGLDASSTSTQGSNATFARSNHTHAIASGVVSTQTPDQVNATGSSTNFARADHIHTMATAAPSANLTTTTTNAQGSSTSFSRADHSHAITTASANTVSTIVARDASGNFAAGGITATSLTDSGLTAGRVTFASTGGLLADDAALLWNNTTKRLGIGRAPTTYPLEVEGKLWSTTGYILGSDLSLIPIVGNQSAISTWWGLQLIGNKQTDVDFSPTPIGNNNDFSVAIPNQQAASTALLIKGVAAQTGKMLDIQASGSTTTLASILSTGMITANNALRLGTTADTTAGNIRYTSSDFEGYHNGVWWSLTRNLKRRYSYVMTSTQSSTSSTYANLTELVSVSLPIGTYNFTCIGMCQSAATGTGYGIRVTSGTSTMTFCYAKWLLGGQGATGTDHSYDYSQIATSTNISSGAVASANTNYVFTGMGGFELSVAGTVAIQLRSENTTAVTAQVGSMFIIEEV